MSISKDNKKLIYILLRHALVISDFSVKQNNYSFMCVHERERERERERPLFLKLRNFSQVIDCKGGKLNTLAKMLASKKSLII